MKRTSADILITCPHPLAGPHGHVCYLSWLSLCLTGSTCENRTAGSHQGHGRDRGMSFFTFRRERNCLCLQL